MSDAWKVQFFGENLVTKTGVRKTVDVLQGKKNIGLYFSAHWCPPCRGFTPTLAENYTSIVEENSSAFEVIFISSDQDTKSFEEYYGSMPWAALPFSDSHKDSLASKYSIRGIPALIILNGETGATIDENGRGTVAGAKGDTAKILGSWAK